MVWRQRLIYVGLLVTALPATMGILLLGRCIYPTMLAFVAQFNVVNQSGETVMVTPIGVTEQGRTVVLAQFSSEWPALPPVREMEHRIPPGGRVTVRFDWDDVQLTELRVRGAEGVEGALAIDPFPSTRNYADRQPQYVVPPLHMLPRATTAYAPRAERKTWILAAVSALFLHVMLWRLLYRLHNPRRHPTATQST